MNKIRRKTLFFRTGIIISFLTVCCASALFAATNDCTVSTNQTYTQTDLNTCAGGTIDNLTVDEGATLTLTEAVILQGNLTLNGTITHAASDIDGVDITAINVIIGASGLINVNAKGCVGGDTQDLASGSSNGWGPDIAGDGSCTEAVDSAGISGGTGSGGGGANGGDGSDAGGTGSGGDSYSIDILTPQYLGSGGGEGSGTSANGGDGGGLVILNLSGDLTVGGAISANGGNGNHHQSGNAGGGGSGGSINIIANNITGDANISANGGNVDYTTGQGGGGGGGKIAINYNDISTYSGTISYDGGTNVSATKLGDNGTLYQEDTDNSDLILVSGVYSFSSGDYNDVTVGAGATVTFSGTTTITGDLLVDGTTTISSNQSGIDNITIDNGGSLTMTGATDVSNDISVIDGTITFGDDVTVTGNVTITSGAINHVAEDTDGLSMIVSGNVTIGASGAINVNSKGYAGGESDTYSNGDGTGAGTAGGNNSYRGGGGAGYGGAGGAANYAAGGISYGSDDASAPISLGSGGGSSGKDGNNDNKRDGGDGGGAVYLNIAGILDIDGSISSNGGAGIITNGGSDGAKVSAGGGSGGSIYLIANELSGSGSITANGGTAASTTNATYRGGGGGGGRIAVYYSVDNWDGSITATGGTGLNNGSDGTVSSTLYTVPSTPSITSPLAASLSRSTTLDLASSSYSSNGKTHVSTDWKIVSTNNCSSGTIAWSSLDDASNLTSITVGSALSNETTYYACVRYANSVGDSSWSSPVAFTTIASGSPSTQNYPYTTAGNYTYGSNVTVSGGEALSSTTAWYDGSWSNRRKITITEESDSDLTNYPVKIDLDNDNFTGGAGGDGAFDIANSDGSDIRIADADGNTLLDYWIESWSYTDNATSDDSAVVWVNLPSISASSTADIYIYYGNSDASDIGDGTSVFTFFDDFETFSGWSDVSAGGTVSQSSTHAYTGTYSAKKTTNGDPKGANKDMGLSTPIDRNNWIVEFFIRRDTADLGTSQAERLGIEDSSQNGYSFNFAHDTDLLKTDERLAGNGTVLSNTTSLTDQLDTWYIGRLVLTPTDVISQMLDTGYNVLGTATQSSETTYTSFTHVAIRGGYSYYVDNYRIRPYLSSEPSISTDSQEDSFNNTAYRIYNTDGLENTALYNFTETLGGDTNGSIKYQLSDDGSNWYYYSGGSWTSATAGNLSQSNTAQELDAYLINFTSDVSSGDLHIAAYLLPDGGTIDLTNIAVTYDPPGADFSTSTLVASDDTPAVGDTITYTATVTNTASLDGTSTVLSIPVPSGMTYVANSITVGSTAKTDASDEDEADYNISTSGAITVNLGTVSASGGEAIVTFDLSVDDGSNHGTVINTTATISAADVDATDVIEAVTVTGALLSNIPSGRSFVLASDGTTDPSAMQLAGSNEVFFRKGANEVAKLNINFGAANVDVSTLSSDVDTDNKKAFVHGWSSLDESVKGADTYTLIVPGSGDDTKRVVICAGAQSLDEVGLDCDDEINVTERIILGDGESTIDGNGNTVSALINGDGNWEVSGLSSTGGGEIPANNLPVATTPTSVSQATDASGYVSFSTTISDDDGEDTSLKVEYSDDGGSSWYDAQLVSVSPDSGSVDLDNGEAYQIGTNNSIDTSSSSVALTIVWDSQSSSNGNGAVTGEQSDIQLRVIANDGFDDGSASASSNFSVDNLGPQTVTNLIVSNYSADFITLQWNSASSDVNFTNYEICYDIVDGRVTEGCSTGNIWDQNDDSDLSTIITNDTTVNGLTEGTTYYFKLIAVDDYGNKTSTANIAQGSNGKPIVSGLTASQDANGDHEVAIQFTANDSDAVDTISAAVEYSLTGNSWSVATLTSVSQSNPATPNVEPTIDNDAFYNIGSSSGYIHTSEGSNVISAIWDIDSDLASTNLSTIQIRVKLFDEIDTGAYVSSSQFVVDQIDPIASDPSVSSSAANQVSLAWTAATDTNFNKYVIYYGTNESTVSSENSSTWTISNDSDLSTIGTTDTTITSLTEENIYYFMLQAQDEYGNTANGSVISFTLDNTAPQGLSDLAATTSEGSTTVTLTWTAATSDLSFANYVIYYSTSQSLVSSEGSGVVVIDDEIQSSLATISTASLDIESLTAGNTYYAKIKAIDSSENEAVTDIISFSIPAAQSSSSSASSSGSGRSSSGGGGINSFVQNLQNQGLVPSVQESSSSSGGGSSSSSSSSSQSSNQQTEIVETEEDHDAADDQQEVEVVEETKKEAELVEKIKTTQGNYPTDTIQARAYIESNLGEHWSKNYYKRLIDLQELFNVEKSSSDANFKVSQLFNVDEKMSRLEVVIAMGDLMNVDLPNQEEIIEAPFTDFFIDDKYVEYVKYFKDAGVVKGYPDGSFRSNALVSRIEALKMVMEALEVDVIQLYGEELLSHYGLEVNPFPDVDLDQWYAPYVLYAYDHKVISGYQDGYFRPLDRITNSQIVKIIILAIEN